jgi:hypothetical protein
MNCETQPTEDVIQLGVASAVTRGGTVVIRIEELGYYTAAGIRDD